MHAETSVNTKDYLLCFIAHVQILKRYKGSFDIVYARCQRPRMESFVGIDLTKLDSRHLRRGHETFV